jgi:hypothetical protein
MTWLVAWFILSVPLGILAGKFASVGNHDE